MVASTTTTSGTRLARRPTLTVMGYYTRQDILDPLSAGRRVHRLRPLLCSVLGPTLPNRSYWLSATLSLTAKMVGRSCRVPLSNRCGDLVGASCRRTQRMPASAGRCIATRHSGPISPRLYHGLLRDVFQTVSRSRSYLVRRRAPSYPKELRGRTS